jgi:GT2 family glycosyltransferase
MSITVILNGFERNKNLSEQLTALRDQTLKPEQILLWYNSPENNNEINYDIIQQIPTALCNVNFGVWARFAFALMCRTKYICIFDDDTIPGKKWLENCYNTIQQHNGLLGTVGLIYKNPSHLK